MHSFAQSRFQQAAPYLDPLEEVFDQYGVEAKLFYTDGECREQDFPGDLEKLGSEGIADRIAERLVTWGADGAISLSIPDENSLRDAVVGERLKRYGVPQHGSLDSTYLFANKWETKLTVAKYGLQTARGMLVDGDLLTGRNLAVDAYRDSSDGRHTDWAFRCSASRYGTASETASGISAPRKRLDQFLHLPYNGMSSSRDA